MFLTAIFFERFHEPKIPSFRLWIFSVTETLLVPKDSLPKTFGIARPFRYFCRLCSSLLEPSAGRLHQTFPVCFVVIICLFSNCLFDKVVKHGASDQYLVVLNIDILSHFLTVRDFFDQTIKLANAAKPFSVPQRLPEISSADISLSDIWS